MDKKYLQGVVLCLLAVISWGTMFPIMTFALKKIDPFIFTFLRYIIIVICLILIGFFIEKKTIFKVNSFKEHLLLFTFGSIGFTGYGFLTFWGQQLLGFNGAIITSIIMATMPMLGIVVTFILKRTIPKMPTFLFILIAFFGVLLVISKGKILDLVSNPHEHFANLVIILGALSWVIYTNGAMYFQHFSGLKYSTLTTMYSLIMMCIVNIILLNNNIITIPSITTIYLIRYELIYMSFISGVIGVLSWNIGNKIITPINGILFINFIPITTIIISLFQGIIPNESQILGAILIIGALIFNNLYLRNILN